MMAAETRPYAFRSLEERPVLTVVEKEETPEEIHARELAELERHVEDVRAAAFEEGRTAGMREGRLLAERDSALQARQTTLRLLSEIAQGVGQLDDALVRMEQDAAGVVAAFLQRTAPALLEAALAERCAELLREAFQQLGETRKLHVRVHEGAVSSIDALLASVDVPAGVEVAVAGDPALSPGSADISWQHGSVVLDPGEILAAIAEAGGGAAVPAYTQNSFDQKEPEE